MIDDSESSDQYDLPNTVPTFYSSKLIYELTPQHAITPSEVNPCLYCNMQEWRTIATLAFSSQL